jgi:hypothetical protein
VNISSLSKTSLVVAALAIVTFGGRFDKAFANQTGTLPVIKTHDGSNELAKAKDNGNLPVIIVPSTNTVSGDGGNGLEGQSYTVTVSLNDITSNDQIVTLTSSHHNIITVDAQLVVPAGSSTGTATFTVPYSSFKHHKNVHLTASCNGGSVETVIQVHYRNEED